MSTTSGLLFPGKDAVAPVRPLPDLPKHWTSLASVFLFQAKTNPDKVFAIDESSVPLTYGDALVRAIAIARHIRHQIRGQKYVGIMIPPSVGGLLANLAVGLLGKTSVNLTYAASSEEPNIAISKCGIKVVLASRQLLKKRSIELDAQCINLEDLKDEISTGTKHEAYLVAKFLPLWIVKHYLPGLNCTHDDIATVMFTSGSTGEPKGVVLSHGNILFNIAQVREHGKIDENDLLLGILPYFHSFGYTATFAAVFALGVSVVCHSNPLDSRKVIELVEKHGITVMLNTPTLMRPYYLRGTKEQFRSVRWLLLGSEKLDQAVAERIKTRLGLMPNEGYGCTELSPVCSGNVQQEVSTPDGRVVPGNKPGTVGQPVAGTAIAIVDRESGGLIEPGSQGEGRIFVSGPQVMQGYLGDEAKTNAVLQNGWYYTGDIGYVDADGFLVITDRESRFAKIGAEMVPIIKVELEIRRIANDRDIHISAIPDEKGEKLVVLYTLEELDVEAVRTQMQDTGMNTLWIPKAGDFHRVESFPIAASGKLDLKALKALAIELSSK